MGIQLQSLPISGPDNFEPAFKAARGADGLLQMDDPLFVAHRTRVAEVAAKNRLPAIFGFREFAEAGGLMSYGADLPDLYRRAATYVDKIFKGTKPADLPVEQPLKFELVINLKTAKQIGLTIPQSVLYRADKVIKEAPG
jgi:putative ABC transport system substrate-binding protein